MIPQRVANAVTEAVDVYQFVRDTRGHDDALRAVATVAFQKGMAWQKTLEKEMKGNNK